MSNSYFITTTIPYVNAKPHIGHAQEFVLADTIARFYRQKSDKVILQSGSDDNAFKNVISAKNVGITPEQFVEENSAKFLDLLSRLCIKTDYFVKTSSPEHTKSVHHLLRQLDKVDVYTASYEGLYCQGCEDFYIERDLVDGLCPDHRTRPEKICEENVFFRLSKYQDVIFDLIKTDKVKIRPESKKKEILNFISQGLSDISLSRSSIRSAGWGIPYPDQSGQVVYVWIDALVNYLSGIGYGRNLEWKNIWNEETHKVHVIGKNVWKFHAIYWLGLLLSAKLPLPNEIIIHGFLTNEGVKISKSLGNGVDPLEVIQSYGVDAVRFYLLHVLSYKEDADFVEGNLKNSYNSELANKLGNLVSRLLTLKQRVPEFSWESKPNFQISDDFNENFNNAFKLTEKLNKEVNEVRPWEFLKNENHEVLIRHLSLWLSELEVIRGLLNPLIPVGCEKISKLFQSKSHRVEQLYPRK